MRLSFFGRQLLTAATKTTSRSATRPYSSQKKIAEFGRKAWQEAREKSALEKIAIASSVIGTAYFCYQQYAEGQKNKKEIKKLTTEIEKLTKETAKLEVEKKLLDQQIREKHKPINLLPAPDDYTPIIPRTDIEEHLQKISAMKDRFLEIVLCGNSGTGKTLAAIDMAQQMASVYEKNDGVMPDIVFIHGPTVETRIKSVAEMAKAIDYDLTGYAIQQTREQYLQDIFEVTLRAFRGRPQSCIIVLDDMDHHEALARMQTRIADKRVLVIITTKNLDYYHYPEYPLINLNAGMPADDALKIFGDHLNKKNRPILSQIVNQLERLPMPIATAAAVMKQNKWTPATYLEKLQQEIDALTKARCEESLQKKRAAIRQEKFRAKPIIIESAIRLVLEQLDQETLALLRFSAALSPTYIDTRLLKAFLQVSFPQTSTINHETGLLPEKLLETVRYYCMHEISQQVIRNHFNDEILEKEKAQRIGLVQNFLTLFSTQTAEQKRIACLYRDAFEKFLSISANDKNDQLNAAHISSANALIDFLKAIDTPEPEINNFRLKLAGFCLTSGINRQGEEILETLMHLPSFSENLEIKVQVYYLAGKLNEANYNYEKAIHFFSMTVELLEKNRLLQQHQTEYRQALTRLAVSHAHRDDLNAQEEYARKLYEFEKKIKEGSPYYAIAMANYALACGANNKPDTEKKYLKKLTILLPQLQEEYKNNLPNLAKIFFNIRFAVAGNHFDQKKLYNADEKINLLKIAIEICEQSFGKSHISCAELLMRLANIELIAGQKNNAEKSIERSLCIYRQHFSEKHLELATIYVHQSIVYSEQGRYAEARTCLEKALEIQLEKTGPYGKTLLTMERLALLNIKEKKYDEALKLLLDVCNHRITLDSYALNTRILLTELYQKMGEGEKAKSTLLQLMSDLEQKKPLKTKWEDRLNDLAHKIIEDHGLKSPGLHNFQISR